LEQAAKRLAAIYKLKPATYFAYGARESGIVAKLSYESETDGSIKKRGRGASNAG
jgi:hypothetical protein